MKMLASKKSRLQQPTATSLAIISVLFVLMFVIKSESNFKEMLCAVLSASSLSECIFSALDSLSGNFVLPTNNAFLKLTFQNCVAGFAMLMLLALKLKDDKEMKNSRDFINWSITAMLFGLCTFAKICAPTTLVYIVFIKTVFDFITSKYFEEFIDDIKSTIKQKNIKVTKKIPEIFRKQHCEDSTVPPMILYKRRQETTVEKRWFFV